VKYLWVIAGVFAYLAWGYGLVAFNKADVGLIALGNVSFLWAAVDDHFDKHKKED